MRLFRGVKKMKHVVLFSGGVQSAYVAYLVAQKEKKEDIILLFAEPHSEDGDNARFRKEVADYLDLPLVETDSGTTIWELLDKKKIFPNIFRLFCNDLLRIRPLRRYLSRYRHDEYCQYLGLGFEEERRLARAKARDAQRNVQTRYPLVEQNIPKKIIIPTIENEWKIRIPQTYKIKPHANCIPCFLGGRRDFFLCWKFYPKRFARFKEYEAKFQRKILGKFLYEFEEMYARWDLAGYLEDDSFKPTGGFYE